MDYKDRFNLVVLKSLLFILKDMRHGAVTTGEQDNLICECEQLLEIAEIAAKH